MSDIVYESFRIQLMECFADSTDSSWVNSVAQQCIQVIIIIIHFGCVEFE